MERRRAHVCMFTSHLFVVICQKGAKILWPRHTTHASYIWLAQHCRWSSNTINWLIATYFLFLLTNKLHYRFSLFNYLQEMIKRRVEVRMWSTGANFSHIYWHSFTMCDKSCGGLMASPSKSITHLQWKCSPFFHANFLPKINHFPNFENKHKNS